MVDLSYVQIEDYSIADCSITDKRYCRYTTDPTRASRCNFMELETTPTVVRMVF